MPSSVQDVNYKTRHPLSSFVPTKMSPMSRGVFSMTFSLILCEKKEFGEEMFQQIPHILSLQKDLKHTLAQTF